MDTLIVILLGFIAYILWQIYRQKEEEREQIANEKFDAEWEAKKKEELKDYPHLYGKLEDNWLEVFAHQHERGTPLLKLTFYLMLEGSIKIDFSEGSMKWDSLWDNSKELLEHLQKYHEGSDAEYEIALCTYWQIAAETIEELIKESPEKTISDKGRESAPIEGEKFEKKPFTNIEKIVTFFPRKENHPAKEISFFSPDGSFPRESKGSHLIDNKLKELGV